MVPGLRTDSIFEGCALARLNGRRDYLAPFTRILIP